VAIVPCTTPRSYAAPLPPSIWGPTSGMGTKSGDGHASPRSPDMTRSWWWQLQHIRAHIPPFNAIHGEDTLEGNGGSDGNTTRH
jgi:hypothetical protein